MTSQPPHASAPEPRPEGAAPTSPGAPQSAPAQPGPQSFGHAQPVPPQPGAALPAGDRPEHYPTVAGVDGRIAWAMGLLGLIPVPGLAALVTGIVMIVVGLRQRRRNPVAKRLGRNAAILGATLLVGVVVFFTLMGIGIATEDPGSSGDTPSPLLLLAAPFGIWMIVIGPLVAVIMGVIALARPVSREKASRILAGR
ncbi:hypothetical protein [Brachybacterium huguangmaarense]